MAISSSDILNRSVSLPQTSNGEINRLKFTSAGFLNFIDVPKGCISIDSFEPNKALLDQPASKKARIVETTCFEKEDESPKKLIVERQVSNNDDGKPKKSFLDQSPSKDDGKPKKVTAERPVTSNDSGKPQEKKPRLEIPIINNEEIKSQPKNSPSQIAITKEIKEIKENKEADKTPTKPLCVERPVSKENDDVRLSYNWKCIDFKNTRSHASGLYNSRNDCFMNSVLQFVFHTPQLLRYILLKRRQHQCSIPDKCIYCVLNKDVDRISRGLTTFEASSMRNIVNCQFPNRILNNQEDAHEMLIFLLSKLEPPLPRRNVQSMNVSKPRVPTEMDKIFGGKLCNKIKCDHCGNFQSSSEEIRELNLNLYGNPNQNARLEDLINVFFKIEKLEDYRCDSCDQRGSIRRLFIENAPNVLIIQLKRFRHNGTKNSTSVEFPLSLNLTNYGIDAKKQQKPPLSYTLYGFISHSGNSANSGHYKATMQGYDGKWYIFDDDYVAQSHPDRFNYQQPYLLFYYRNSNTTIKKPFSNGTAQTFTNRPTNQALWKLNKGTQNGTKPQQPSVKPYQPQKNNGAFKWPVPKNGISNGNGQAAPSNGIKRPLNEQNNQNGNHYQNGSNKRPQNGYNSQNGNYRSPMLNGFNKNRMFEYSTYHQRS